MKAAVIGVGNMGKHHARVYAQMSDVELVAVADPSVPALEAIADLWDTAVYLSPERMLMSERPDIVSIAAPTSQHCLLTTLALAYHCHVLVEKPIAKNIVQAKSMVAMAETESRVLAVGHIERCNPIVKEIGRRLADLGQLYWIDTRRSGPPPLQEPTEGVLLDLAVHDLDIMRYFLGAESMGYSAITLGAMGENRLEDMALVIIEFSTGVIGTLEVDRISAQKQRFLRVAGERGSLTADYILQRGHFIGPDGKKEPVLVMGNEEPLYLELRDFVSAVREGRLPMTTGEESMVVLQMVLDIKAQVEQKGIRSCYNRGGQSFNA